MPNAFYSQTELPFQPRISNPFSPSPSSSSSSSLSICMALIASQPNITKPHLSLPLHNTKTHLHASCKTLKSSPLYPKAVRVNPFCSFPNKPFFKTSQFNKRTPFSFHARASSSLSLKEEEDGKGDKFRRILLSDVVVKGQRRVFWGGRKWNALDVSTAGVVLAMHLFSLLAPFCFNWGALGVAVFLYFVTGLFGITLSFHRNLSHRSFKLPKWLEYTFAYCGVLALQGNPIDWVSTHRYHHQFCDSERDPHSPMGGFWFSHMSWLFDTNSIIERCGGPNNAGDLQKQPFYRFLQSTYIAHPIALGVLLYALGGLPFLVWGMGVRIIWVYHVTWLVNSACHVWGKQAWNTGDLSRNNWWVALLAFGEGWHNNHHAFEFSARHGLEWWQIDLTWYIVRFLQAIGLATEVKLPSEIQKHRMAWKATTS